MKHLVYTLLVFFLLNNFALAQFNQQFIELLDEAMSELDSTINPKGLSIAVMSGNDIWSGAIGVSAAQDSLNNNSLLAMGSITKTFISAEILGLMEEDKLALNNPIHYYLPAFENIDSSATIKELLNHTSGIYNYTDNPIFFDSVFSDTGQWHIFSPEEVIENFVLSASFERGTKQEYSNTNYVLLGMIISEITNKPYYEAIFERFNIAENYPTINVPSFNSDPTDLANLWFNLGFGLQDVEAVGIGLHGLFSSAGAAGALACTPTDLVKWGYDLYTGKLLNASSMDSLFDYHPFQLFGQTDYGLGVFSTTSECGVMSVGHSGGILYTANLFYSEEFDLSVCVMTNDGDGITELGGVIGITEEIICAYQEASMTSSSESNQATALHIYPNPTQDILNIRIDDSFGPEIQINIYNELGSLVLSQTTRIAKSEVIQINALRQWPSGMYFIQLKNGSQTYTEKIIKN